MKKNVKLFSTLFFCIALAIGLSSCSDDGYSLDKYWVSIATVNKVEDGTYDFVLDDGKKLWVATPLDLDLKYNRAIINYTILSDKHQGYDYVVKLNRLSSVLTKEIIYVAPNDKEEQDRVGNNPIKIRSVWVSGGYMNISFEYKGGGAEAHMINLVSAQPDLSISEDTVKLELRHNKQNDPELYPIKGYVSFDLKPYKKADRNEVAFEIQWLDFDGQIYRYDTIYNLFD